MRLIKGGLDYSCVIGATQLGIVPLEAPAPEVDAVVIEQDTHTLLAVDAQPVEISESLIEVADQLEAFVPYTAGTVVVRRAEPLQLFAIVHDLDCTPSWQEAWIESALEQTLTIANKRQLKRLGMAPLGSVHGRFPLERFIQLLVMVVARHGQGVRQLWLGVKRRECTLAIEQLKHHCATLPL